MRRTWRFRQPLRELLVVRRADAGPEDVREALPGPAAAATLRDVIRESGHTRGAALPWLYEMCDLTVSPLFPPGRLRLTLTDRLESSLLRGRLLVIPKPLPTGAGITVFEAIPLEEPPREEPKKEEPSLTWIEIELLNEAGEPIPREPYVLTLPDGKIRKGRLDQHGFARVDSIPDGDCQVTFPGFDGREWAKK